MKKMIIAIVAVCALLIAAYVASPVIAVHSFVGAARSGDPDKLETNVDFPAVRDSLKSQLGAALMVHLQSDPDMKDNPFAGLATMMGPAIVDRMIDTIVTPDGIAALVRQGKLHEDANAVKAPAGPVDYDYGYLSLDRFRVTLKGKDAANPAKLIFERRGIFSWKLIKIEIPDSVFADKPTTQSSPATAPDPSATGESDDAVDADTQAAGNFAPSPVFLRPVVPMPIEQIDCHMGECTWQQIESVADVKRVGDAVLRVVGSRLATTETPEGKDYPTTLPSDVPVTWHDSTSYDLCSIAHPASISWDDDTNSYLVTALNVAAPFGYQIAAVAEYKTVCHGLAPDAAAYLHPEQLGYVDAGDSPSQYHVKKPEQVFASSVDR